MARTNNDRPGLVLSTDGVAIWDTNGVDWEPFAGADGVRMKVLARDEGGAPSVFLLWVAAGQSKLPRLARPHFKTNFRERGLVLSGEIAMREYADASDAVGIPVTLRSGYYVDRSPGGIHGSDPEAPADQDFLWLQWYEWVGDGPARDPQSDVVLLDRCNG